MKLMFLMRRSEATEGLEVQVDKIFTSLDNFQTFLLSFNKIKCNLYVGK